MMNPTLNLKGMMVLLVFIFTERFVGVVINSVHVTPEFAVVNDQLKCEDEMGQG